MKNVYLIISLFAFSFGSLNVNGQSSNTVENVVDKKSSLLQDSIVRGHFSSMYEKVYVVHRPDSNASKNHKWINEYEMHEYFAKQRDVMMQVEKKILDIMPRPFLNKSLEYKYNPVFFHMVVSARKGVVESASIWINNNISALISDNLILELDDIILKTRLVPFNSEIGDKTTFDWVISRQRIKEFLNVNKGLE